MAGFMAVDIASQKMLMTKLGLTGVQILWV